MATTDSTTRPGATKQDVLALVEEYDIQFIRLWFTDILGQLKSFAVGKAELEGALEEGMGFDGSSITGFNAMSTRRSVRIPQRRICRREGAHCVECGPSIRMRLLGR